MYISKTQSTLDRRTYTKLALFSDPASKLVGEYYVARVCHTPGQEEGSGLLDHEGEVAHCDAVFPFEKDDADNEREFDEEIKSQLADATTSSSSSESDSEDSDGTRERREKAKSVKLLRRQRIAEKKARKARELEAETTPANKKVVLCDVNYT